jgi:hypothetical protein
VSNASISFKILSNGLKSLFLLLFICAGAVCFVVLLAVTFDSFLMGFCCCFCGLPPIDMAVAFLRTVNFPDAGCRRLVGVSMFFSAGGFASDFLFTPIFASGIAGFSF